MSAVQSHRVSDWSVFALVVLTVGSGLALAQDRKPKVYELRNGVFQPAAPVTLKSSSGKLPMVETRLPATTAVSGNHGGQSHARELLRMAAEIERLSGQSFQRGLLNIEDHAEQLDVVLQLRLAAAERSSSPDAAQRFAYAKRAEALRSAAVRTATMQQVGAAGWASESAYGQLLASSAAADWAKARGDQLAQHSWAEKSKRFAQNLVTHRGWDHRMGLAGDRQLLDAQTQVATTTKSSGQSERNAAEVIKLRKMINSHVTRLEQMQPRPAGNTRPDELHAARARLLAVTANMELMAGRKTEAKRALMDADRHAALEFRDLRKFQRTGTAGLPELIRNWRGRKQVHQSLIDAGFEIPNNHWAGRQRDLKAMADIADRTLDRRGRNGADVAVVQGLVLLESVRPFVKQPTSTTGRIIPSGSVRPKVYNVREEIQRSQGSPRSSERGPIIRDIPPRRTPPTPLPRGESSAP